MRDRNLRETLNSDIAGCDAGDKKSEGKAYTFLSPASQPAMSEFKVSLRFLSLIRLTLHSKP
jgi:hypothetical protein